MQIEYKILSQPRLLENDNHRITFTGFNKGTMKEVVCQTHFHVDAQAFLKKMQGWSDVLIEGDYIPNSNGLTFRVENILPKAKQTAHN